MKYLSLFFVFSPLFSMNDVNPYELGSLPNSVNNSPMVSRTPSPRAQVYKEPKPLVKELKIAIQHSKDEIKAAIADLRRETFQELGEIKASLLQQQTQNPMVVQRDVKDIKTQVGLLMQHQHSNTAAQLNKKSRCDCWQ